MIDPTEPMIPAPTAAPARTHRRRGWLIGGAAAFAMLLAGAAVWTGAANSSDAVVAAQVQTRVGQDWGSDDWTQDLWSQLPSWEDLLQGLGGYDYGSQGGTQDAPQSSGQNAASAASASESTGVVIINTELGYGAGEAAGTGMVLTSNGLILTNNHVIDGSTTIKVTDPSTDETYTAKVVGSDATNDVALLKLEGATNLTPIAIDKDDDEAVGDPITAVGNASGGGVLMAADSTITDTDASVTTSTNAYEKGETLKGTIEISADVVAGDSGGALLDSDGEVIGMNTAASTGSGDTVAYAIPIETALGIVAQIERGDDSGTVTLGYPAFLGVGLAQDQTGGASLAYVYDGTPAAKAGIVAGDTVTAVNGKHVADGAALSTALKAHAPGDTVKITWTDANGTSHTAKVTLVEGPAA